MVRSLNDTLSYIGVDDLRIDLFESQYPVPEGISYNSYVLRAGKTAVFDTVDASAAEQWKTNLSEALAGGTPDYLVIHHLEPDHSGLIGWMLETYPGVKAVLSVKAAQMLPQFLDEGFSLEGRLLTVKDGDSLDLGGATLCFFTAPMVHWPEVTVSLWQEKGLSDWKQDYAFPLVLTEGTNQEGKRLTWYLNYAKEPQRCICPQGGTELFSGETYAPGQEILVGGWDLRIVES